MCSHGKRWGLITAASPVNLEPDEIDTLPDILGNLLANKTMLTSLQQRLFHVRSFLWTESATQASNQTAMTFLLRELQLRAASAASWRHVKSV